MWRRRHETPILFDLDLPSVIATSITGDLLDLPGTDPLVGGFTVEALACCEIWRKLIEGELGSSRLLMFDLDPGLVESAVPRSRHSLTFTASDPSARWRSLLGSENPAEGFALMKRGESNLIAMIGLPTEDAWERFCSYAVNR